MYRSHCLAGSKRSGLLLLWAFLIPFGSVYAQSQITGTVRDGKSGRPLPGANVFLEGTTYGTATDNRGQFALKDLRAGSYSVVVSMVGYASAQKSVRLRNQTRSSLELEFELQPKVTKLKGITVEGSRDEWLDRLEQFRSVFFGNVPNANSCEFINPEVLSFKETENGLLAYAKRPLRVRNRSLGYEVTYHLSSYEAYPGSRRRYGKLEFDTLAAKDQEQRTEWARARKRSYRGSFRHFVDALAADALKSEGFRIRLASTRSVDRDRERSPQSVSNWIEASEITEPAAAPWRIVLSIPRGKYLEVQYLREAENAQFARRYRHRSPRSYQTSWVQIVGGSRVLVDTRSGDFLYPRRMGFGHYVLTGYWGWYETAATALPGNYRPPDTP